jgi:hypothetical protein
LQWRDLFKAEGVKPAAEVKKTTVTPAPAPAPATQPPLTPAEREKIIEDLKKRKTIQQ